MAVSIRPAGRATLERFRPYQATLAGPDFRLLFVGQALSQLGDWINRVALVVLVYQLTGRQAAVALVILAELLPRAIVLPFGGVLADRYPKRRLMLFTDLARAGLAASLMLVTSARGLWWLCAAVLLMQALSAVFNPARSATLPALVPREHLGLANALNGMSAQLAFFLGPALGGLIMAHWGVGAVFAINALTFLLSALLLWRMRLREPGAAGLQRGQVSRDLREGWATVAGNPALWVLFGGAFVISGVALSLNVLLVAILTGTLGRPPEALGLLMTVVGLGTLVGTLPAPHLLARFSPLRLIVLLVLGLTLDMAVIGSTASFPVVTVALFVNGLFSMVVEVAIETGLQRLAPADRLGRAFGLLFWVATLGQVGGAAAGGALPSLLGTRGTVVALSVVFAGVLLAILTASVLALRVAGAQPAETGRRIAPDAE